MLKEQYFRQILERWVNHPLFGLEIDHYRAQHAPDSAFNSRGEPDYLAESPGFRTTGVQYPDQPTTTFRGVFCPTGYQPIQDEAGIYYTAETQIITLQDLGQVYQVEEGRPKLQDKFVVSNGIYYAASPKIPCQQGSVVAGWQIMVTAQRYPVANDQQ
ncbi:MAG: hypothetical protein ABEI54_03115 [Candidatus Bipolaricaulia bacterium]